MFMGKLKWWPWYENGSMSLGFYTLTQGVEVDCSGGGELEENNLLCPKSTEPGIYCLLYLIRNILLSFDQGP